LNDIPKQIKNNTDSSIIQITSVADPADPDPPGSGSGSRSVVNLQVGSGSEIIGYRSPNPKSKIKFK